MRRVHTEGQRERQAMREHTPDHSLEPQMVDTRGRIHWCCPHHMTESKEQGVLDRWLVENDYEYDDGEGRYVSTDGGDV